LPGVWDAGKGWVLMVKVIAGLILLVLIIYILKTM
jgi:hypothetical protein